MAAQTRYLALLRRKVRSVALLVLTTAAVSRSLFASETAHEHVRRALESYHSQKYQQAQLELQQSLKEYPDDPASHELLGLVLDLQDEPDAARTHLETALRLAST